MGLGYGVEKTKGDGDGGMVMVEFGLLQVTGCMEKEMGGNCLTGSRV